MSDLTARGEFIRDLRAIADFYDTYDVPIPSVFRLDAFLETKAEIIEVARKLGTVQKGVPTDNWFFLTKKFGNIQIDWNVARKEVCERVVVGQREVPERLIPASLEDVVEWRCDPILGGEA